MLASDHLLDQDWLLLLHLHVLCEWRLEHWHKLTGHDRLVDDLWLDLCWGSNNSSFTDEFVSQWVLLGLEILVDDVLDVIGVDDVHD